MVSAIKIGAYTNALLLMLVTTAGMADINQPETVTVTATRHSQTTATLATSLSVLSKQDLQQISAVHVSEAMTRVPGVWVSRGNGQEHLTAIRSPVLTGTGSCGAFYIAEDGVPVRATGFCNVNQLFDINTEQAQRIEVLRGPGTVIHGSDALHGVINVISQAPANIREEEIAVEFGANDYSRIKLNHSDSDRLHGYRININGAHDGGYKDESGFDQQKLTARHDYHRDEISLQTLLSLSNLNQETAAYVEGNNAYKDSHRRRENPAPEAFRDSQSARIQTRFEKQLDHDAVFVATPYARHTDMQFIMHFLPGTPLEENRHSGVGLQTSIHQPMSTHLALTHGFDMELTEGHLKQSQAVGFSTFTAGKQYDYAVDARLLAAFINADYTLSPDTRIDVGSRYEYLHYDYDNRMLTGNTAEDGSLCINSFTGQVGCRYTRPQDSRDDFDNLSINTSLLHQLTDKLTGIVRLAHGFRAPQAAEMYRLQNGQLQAGLDSEEINSIELGLRAASETFSYQLTSFYMKKNNVIFQSSERLNLDDGQTEHIGLEYELFWQIHDNWDLKIAGTFARHQYRSNVSTPGPASGQLISTDGNDIDTAPRRMGSVQLGWQPTSNTAAELEWLTMGKYYTDIDNLHHYDGHQLWHLRLRQQLTDKITLGLRINNLANTDYAERADYSSFTGDQYFVGEPRSYFADITVKF